MSLTTTENNRPNRFDTNFDILLILNKSNEL